MKQYFLSKDNFFKWVELLGQEYQVYAPLKKEEFLLYEKINSENIRNIVLDTKRAVHPLKSFFTPAYRKVAEYFVSSSESSKKSEKRILLGVKACDLKALKITDSVYQGEEFGREYKDPFYIQARENTLIISSDCKEPDNSCFCTLVGGNPYPQEGFDLNLSSLEEGYVVEVGSSKGEEVVQKNPGFFTDVEEKAISKKQRNREKVIKLVNRINKDLKVNTPYRELIKDTYDSPVWLKYSEKCVDCGGCNQICPTCRCFLLSDVKTGDKYQRYYLWDACLLTGFARVAGGANPRPWLHQRFANRLFCKFYFFPENINLDACTGCGRCISVCIGKIDMREVFRDLAIEKKIPVGQEK